MAVEETGNDSKIWRSEAQKEKEHGTEVPCSVYLCPTGGRQNLPRTGEG
jgi:hypothetical protein